MRLRQQLIAERERLDLTQQQVATLAGVGQGLVSRWEDLSVTMTDPSARVLFQIVERAFGKTLTAFFAEIEQVPLGAQSAERIAAPLKPEGRAYADPLPPAISRSDLERFARTIGRSIGREIRPQITARSPPKARARRAKRR